MGEGSEHLSEDGKQWWDGSQWRPVPEKDGAIILFTPTAPTTTAAIFAHGVEAGDEIDPVGGVTLGYYSEHGNALDANITWAAGAPTHPPQKTGGQPDKWASYVLTTIGVARPAELAPTANEYGIAIAYVVDPTSTKPVVEKLAGLGYTDIRGVHCRESISGSGEAPTFGDAAEITHQTLIDDEWKDSADDPITADTDLAQDEPIIDRNGTYYKIASVVEPKAKYTIAPHTS